MEVYIMPSLGSIIYQILFLIVIASLIYSWFLFVKAGTQLRTLVMLRRAC